MATLDEIVGQCREVIYAWLEFNDNRTWDLLSESLDNLVTLIGTPEEKECVAVCVKHRQEEMERFEKHRQEAQARRLADLEAMQKGHEYFRGNVKNT